MSIHRDRREYSIAALKKTLADLSEEYDLARIVDPNECRIIDFAEDGSIAIEGKCYGIWKADCKCTHCSSATACRTRCGQHKTESFDGRIFQIESNPVSVIMPDGGTYDAVVELVTIESDEGTAANDRLAENIDHAAEQYRSVHDDLTQVLRAEAFYEAARNAIAECPNGKWVMVTSDIMNFKLVNTLFGVSKGDEVLVETAKRLDGIALSSDGICGRIGGDQFALLLPGERFDEKQLLAVQEELAIAFNCGIYTFVVHFGVYPVSNSAIPISVMCGRANSALATIKQSVKETVAYFDDAILERTIFEQAVIGGFSEALEHGQFKMFLQPLVGKDGTMFGGEALARWVRPDNSIVMPGDFIEVLERAGMVHELDMYIWECAVKQLALWKSSDNRNMVISVNMSAKDLFNIDVYGVLCNLLDRYQVEAGRLRLEITETALLEDPQNSGTVLSRLQDRGFIIEIDDFGKGYSSLSMLKDIHADVLKIDMSLLQEIESKNRSKVILKSIIQMAGNLGMDVITEGVENETQLETLLEMGCDRFQGYYFGKPMTVSDFEKAAMA